MPIKIDFLANVRDFLRGTSDVDRALDDTADSLDDVARDGDRATEKLERSFRDLADSARDEGRRADRELGKIGDSGGGLGRAGAATGEFKQEALQNFSEVTSSFDGSMTSIQDLAQGTFGGLASGLPGPLGLAAGGIAIGVGLIGSAFAQTEEKRLKLEERANDLAEAYIEAGGQVLDALTIAERSTDILTGDRRQEAEDLARVLGGDLSLAVRILAGDTDALAQAQTIQAAAEEKLADLNAAQRNNTGKRKTEIGEEIAALETLTSALSEQEQIQRDAAETARIQSDILKDLVLSAGEATVKVDEFGNKLIELPDGQSVVIDAETGLATTNLDAFKGKADEIDGTTVTARAAVVDADAQADMDRIIQRLSGRTVYINTRARAGGGEF